MIIEPEILREPTNKAKTNGTLLMYEDKVPCAFVCWKTKFEIMAVTANRVFYLNEIILVSFGRVQKWFSVDDKRLRLMTIEEQKKFSK